MNHLAAVSRHHQEACLAAVPRLRLAQVSALRRHQVSASGAGPEAGQPLALAVVAVSQVDFRVPLRALALVVGHVG